MAGRTLGYAVLFLVPIILVRLFNQEEFGTYNSVLLYGTILNLAQVGMSESLFYFIPGSSEEASRYVCNSILVLGGIGLLTGGLCNLGGDVIAQYLNNSALSPLMPLLAAYFPDAGVRVGDRHDGSPLNILMRRRLMGYRMSLARP